MSTRSPLHQSDFYAWSREQAALLRSGDWERADVERIAEEIESMGKSEKRELVSRLTVLLMHLLKWRYQPSGRSHSWRLSIENSRDEIADVIDDNPSLKAVVDALVESAYRYARRKAAIETGLGEDTFPPVSPWTFAEATAPDFWPA